MDELSLYTDRTSRVSAPTYFVSERLVPVRFQSIEQLFWHWVMTIPAVPRLTAASCPRPYATRRPSYSA
ncbi:unnamed protein product [Peniophora sp. CBMAI 1063]|nr:unnamed protein product [Peniophora sp. CBMAI 1063]